MNFLKKFSCLIIAATIILPYTAFAEENVTYHEAIAVSPYDTGKSAGISLQSVQEPITSDEAEMLEYIVGEIPKMGETIAIPENYQISEERFREVFGNHIGFLIQHEHPEIFYLNLNYFTYRYQIMKYPDNPEPVVSAVSSLPYIMTADEIEETQKKIDAEVDGIVSQATGMTDLEKALFVHDYIVSNYEYDSGYQNRTLDKMVLEKKGVCQGYSYLYMTVMNELGVDCVTVPTDELEHMWNKVKIDDVWYNVDLTYDDPISDISSDVNHIYFLVNDDEIKALDTRKHGVWNECKWDGSLFEVSDSYTFFNSPLHDIQGSTVYKDGTFYALDSVNNICEVVFEDSVQVLRPIYTLSSNYKWYLHDSNIFYLTDYYSTLALYNNKIYFNSPNTIYEFNPSDSSAEPVYEYDGPADISRTYLYGMRAVDGTLYAEHCATFINPLTGGIKSTSVTLVAITVPDDPVEPPAEPEESEFPIFEEPLPCTVETNVATVTITVENEEGETEDVEAQQVTITVDIPEEVTAAVDEVKNTVTVKVAKYADGAFIGFEDVTLDAENSTASFTLESGCDTVKTFVWAGFIMPLAMAEGLNLTAE